MDKMPDWLSIGSHSPPNINPKIIINKPELDLSNVFAHDDTNSEVEERQDLPGEQFWYKYEYVYFVQLDGRLDVQLGAAPVGVFVSGGLGLNVSHGRVYNLQFDVDEQGNIIDDTGTERRDPSDEFTWPSLQSTVCQSDIGRGRPKHSRHFRCSASKVLLTQPREARY